jgi:transcriptional regulator with XRE-family HTH domain
MKGKKTRGHTASAFPGTAALPHSRSNTPYDAGFNEKAQRQLDAIRTTLQLTGAELADLFGVSRQAVEQWMGHRVPTERAADIDRLAEVTEELAKRFKAQRLPAIARGPLPLLDDRSILETLTTQGVQPLYEFFRRWASYIPNAEPIRARDYPKNGRR